MSSREILLQRFQELHNYLNLLGEHVNQINTKLNDVEKNLDEIREQHNTTIKSSQTELEQIHEIMVLKSDVETLLQDINNIIRGTLVPLPTTVEKEKY